MSESRYRVIDTSGSEIGVITDERPALAEDSEITLPDGATATVLEV